MQKITIIGRLGRDAAIRETQDGGKVVSFTVACNGRYRGVEKTSWYEVSTFNYERYKNMIKYLTKGSSVIVVGELDADLDEGRDGVTRVRRSIVADSIEFNSNGTSGNTQTATTERPAAATKKAFAPKEDIPDDTEVEVTVTQKKTASKVKPVAEQTVEVEAPEDDTEAADDLPF